MKFNDYPFLRYVLFFALGILAYGAIGGSGQTQLVWLIAGSLGLYLVLLFFIGGKPKTRLNWCFPVLAYLLLIGSGCLLAYQKDVSNKADHISNFNDIQGYMGVVLDVDDKKPNTFANRVEIKKVKTKDGVFTACGEVLIYHQLDTGLWLGDVIWLSGQPQRIQAPNNPEEFDYRSFLANRQIYHSHFVGKDVQRLGMEKRHTFHQFIADLREKVKNAMDRFIRDDEARHVAKAVIIGEKQALDDQVSQAYVKAGAMHILAVSGLHVGMIYGFFFLFFKPYQLSVGKRVVYLSMVVILIWCYAAITGLSPSVMRAATMFTILSIAQMKSRSPSILNSLALSAMILMVFNPFIIYEVGFQLSYAAVLGIVILQPWIASLLWFQNKFLNYFWEITSVSIAAQLATFPISAYYFHVFPNYGLIANLVAIPGAFLVMAIGLPFMILAILGFFVSPFAYLLERVVGWLNALVFGFQKFPFAQTEGIYIGIIGMLVFWGSLACIYMLIRSRRKSYAYWLYGLLVFWGIYQLGLIVGKGQKEALYVYGLNKGFAMDYYYKGKLYSHASDTDSEELEYMVKPHQGRLAPNSKFRLLTGNDEEGEVIYLPNGKVLRRAGNVLDISPLKTKEVSFFEEGTWKKGGEMDVVLMEDIAIRIILR